LAFLTAASNVDLPYFARTVVLIRNGGKPSTNTVAKVLDFNHNRIRAIGYTQADIDAIDSGSIAFFKSQFGMDFSTALNTTVLGAPFPPGGLYLPAYGAVMIPYANSDPVAVPDAIYHVAYDTAHIDRGRQLDWIVRDLGNIVVFISLLPNSAGVFPGGVMAGTKYGNSSNLFYGEYAIIKRGGNYSDPNCGCKERFKAQSIVPSDIVVNSQGQNDVVHRLRVFDEAGNPGLALAVIYLSANVNNQSDVSQYTRGVLTFDCAAPGNSQVEPPTLCPVSGAGYVSFPLIALLFSLLSLLI